MSATEPTIRVVIADDHVLVAGGKTTAHIAAVLVITKNTVRTHIGNLLGKLELESRVAAIA